VRLGDVEGVVEGQREDERPSGRRMSPEGFSQYYREAARHTVFENGTNEGREIEGGCCKG
jgi:hypothetical protein